MNRVINANSTESANFALHVSPFHQTYFLPLARGACALHCDEPIAIRAWYSRNALFIERYVRYKKEVTATNVVWPNVRQSRGTRRRF